jgi:acylphosphatase
MCRLFKVTGRVQGVFFRVSTRDVAVPLGIHGHAVNLADGSVEVRACGSSAAVDELEAWLHDGPRNAVVDSVTELDAACTKPDRFSTG